MSTDGDACTALPDHRMARTSPHFEFSAKILELLFSVGPQLEEIAWMPCEYAILQESLKKKRTTSCHRTSPATPQHHVTQSTR